MLWSKPKRENTRVREKLVYESQRRHQENPNRVTTDIFYNIRTPQYKNMFRAVKINCTVNNLTEHITRIWRLQYLRMNYESYLRLTVWTLHAVTVCVCSKDTYVRLN